MLLRLVVALCLISGCGRLSMSRPPPHIVPINDGHLLSALLASGRYRETQFDIPNRWPIDLVIRGIPLTHIDHLAADTDDHTGHGLRICPVNNEHFASDITVCPFHRMPTEAMKVDVGAMLAQVIAEGAVREDPELPDRMYRQRQIEEWLEPQVKADSDTR